MHNTHQECCQNGNRSKSYAVGMVRFVVLLLLTFGLLLSCRANSSLPVLKDWETGQTGTKLTVQTRERSQPFVWWEAEKPTQTNFPPAQKNPFAPANETEAELLSEKQWIGVEGKRAKPLFLEYQVEIPTDSSYFFYSRKFWKHGPFRWRWDDQPWRSVGKSVYLIDSVRMRQFVAVNWVSLGNVNLTAGRHTLRIELTENDGGAAFDCFVLTTTPLQPQGKLKPNESYTATIPDGFLFTPESDRFAASPIDLRSLNETVAGENGWIQAKGDVFVHAKTGQPERFWAVNVGADLLQMDAGMMRSMARFWAKHGVNLVRLHGPLWSEDLKPLPPAELNKVFTFVATMKQEGIYTALSIYFPVWLELQENSLFPGYNGQHPFALLFFNPEFQQLYFAWWQALLTTPDPLTGKALRDDPALAMVELVNEDSYFFWTFKPYESVPAQQMAILERQFATWITAKYGSLEKARTAWKQSNPAETFKVNGDRSNGAVGILPIGEITAQRETQRAKDTAAFLAESQATFFKAAIAYLRKELNYQGLIYASNWITADAQRLGPLDKYTNTVADFMDRHGYFGGRHEGPRASYSLNPDDIYEDRSALLFTDPKDKQKQDFSLPIMDIRYNNLPSTITEINWVMPNRFRADFPLLAASYGLLQGTDGFFFFAAERPGWDDGLGKFAIASPVVMGQFPATALIFRKGLLQPGISVADIPLKTADLFDLQGAPVTAPQNLDEFRAKDVPPGQALRSDRVSSIDPLAFLVGQVNLQFTHREGEAQQVELSQWINRQAKTVRSSSDQLLWDYQRGLVTVNAPQVQGVTGFLRQAGVQELPQMRVSAEMDYGTVLLVALDNQPLKTSRRMLLQVMSEEQNFGWKTSGKPRKTIESIGNSAIAVRNLAGKIALRRPDAGTLTVTALDFNGYPKQQIGKANDFQLQHQTFYYLLEESQP